MAYIGNVSGFDDVDAEQIKDGAVSDVKISDVDHSKVTGLGAEISTAVSNLVDSSPESLNTLNELAAALGDDASFSTTVTNSIATKLPLAGGTMTGDTLHGDNVKATYGAGGDLEIYHDGSHSRIADRGTGDLRIYGDSLQLNSWTSGENYLTGETDGAVTAYHNGAAKLATTSTGIDVTGVVTADGLTLGDNEKAKFGTGDDLEIYHDGSNSVITDVGVGNLEIRAANIRIKNPSQTKSYLNGNDGGAITIFHDGAQKLATTATGIDVTGTVTADGLTVDGASSINNHLTLGNAYSLGWGDFNERISGNNAGYLNFFTNALERMRIDSSGNVGIGTSTPSTYGVDGAEDLVIGQADGNHGITISSWNASNGTLAFTDTTNATVGRGYLDYDHAVNAMTVGTNGTERMRIDSSGNVGIGTSSPTQKLDVRGILHIQPNNTSSVQTGITLKDSGGGSSEGINIQWTSASDGNTAFIGSSSYDVLRMGTAGTERLRINASGNVGIGTSSPSASLHVDKASIGEYFRGGSGNTRHLNISSFDTASPHAGHDFNASSGNGVLTFSTSSTERMRISSDGEVTTPLQPHWHGGVTNAAGSGIANSATTRTSRGGLTFSASSVTAPVAGVYQICFNTICPSSTGRVDAHISVNGVIVLETLSESGGVGFHYRSGSLSILLNVNDYVQFSNSAWYDLNSTTTTWKSASVTLLS